MKINMDARNHPQTMPAGPAGIENASVDAIEGSSPMILNAMPKTSIIVKLRRSSCLYPSLAVMMLAELARGELDICLGVRHQLHWPEELRLGHSNANVG